MRIIDKLWNNLRLDCRKAVLNTKTGIWYFDFYNSMTDSIIDTIQDALKNQCK